MTHGKQHTNHGYICRNFLEYFLIGLVKLIKLWKERGISQILEFLFPSVLFSPTPACRLALGSLEDHEYEYFGGVLLGVRQLIQNHLRDVQGKFHDQFQSLEIEIQRRDDLIAHLQNRINELEGRGDHVMTPIGEVDREIASSDSSTTGSSIELPFMVSSVSVICVAVS